MTKRSRLLALSPALAVALALALAACATAPETRAEQEGLEQQASAALQSMQAADPTLRSVLDDAHGYVIFPEISEGAAVVGGAGGTGVVYEQGRPIGYATLSHATIGPQLGGQSFSELIVFEDSAALERLKAGDFDLTAEAEATALRSGVSARTEFQDGVAVFVDAESGLFAGASVGGQRIDFEPSS
jgi:lipid-binding SYLF domain-containing protein